MAFLLRYWSWVGQSLFAPEKSVLGGKVVWEVITKFYLLISAVKQSFDDIYIWLKLISLLPGKIVIAAAFFCCVCLVQLQVLLSWRFCYCVEACWCIKRLLCLFFLLLVHLFWAAATVCVLLNCSCIELFLLLLLLPWRIAVAWYYY